MGETPRASAVSRGFGAKTVIINPADLACMDRKQIAHTGELFLANVIAQGMTIEALPNLALLFQHIAEVATEMSPDEEPKPRILERQDNVLTVNFRRA